MDDLVERLRDTGLHSAAVAAARIEYLEKRLEIVPGLSETADGISCRDETIKLQDARITALETSLAEARRQALEEAAKVADTIMRGEVTGLKLDSSYRAGIRWAGERIKDAIRALASDEVKA